MGNLPLMSGEIDVAIIGGGPAGLAAATELKRAGVARVVVLEREAEAGGIPRHCGHPPFGLREFGRIFKGPTYARHLVKRAVTAGVEIHLLTTVIEANVGASLLVSNDTGLQKIAVKRVVYATGVREKPRSSRLISGDRCQGVINTGALQSMVFLKHQRPFKNPVIVGTELVSFSAISTSRHAGIKPVAMIEAGSRGTARWPTSLYPAMVGVPLHLNTRLVAIHGEKSVTGITVSDRRGGERHIKCDGVILTGEFTPESTLGRMGHLEIDPATGGPVIDQFGRCTDPAYFAAGNLLRPVETAGWSWNEGRLAGQRVAADLKGELQNPAGVIEVDTTGDVLKYAVPQRLVQSEGPQAMTDIQLRVNRAAQGEIIAKSGGKQVGCWAINTRKERRILIPVGALIGPNVVDSITLHFVPY